MLERRKKALVEIQIRFDKGAKRSMSKSRRSFFIRDILPNNSSSNVPSPELHSRSPDIHKVTSVLGLRERASPNEGHLTSLRTQRGLINTGIRGTREPFAEWTKLLQAAQMRASLLLAEKSLKSAADGSKTVEFSGTVGLRLAAQPNLRGPIDCEVIGSRDITALPSDPLERLRVLGVHGGMGLHPTVGLLNCASPGSRLCICGSPSCSQTSAQGYGVGK